MIRKMLKSDYDGVRKLMKQVHQLHYINRPDIFRDGDALSQSYFAKFFQDEYFHYVYVKDDEIVGLLMMEHHVKPGYEVVNDRNVFYISDLVVDENHRKSGIGRELYDYAEGVAKAYEATGIELTVWSFNQDAIRFYESLGMTPMNMTMEKKV